MSETPYPAHNPLRAIRSSLQAKSKQTVIHPYLRADKFFVLVHLQDLEQFFQCCNQQLPYNNLNLVKASPSILLRPFLFHRAGRSLRDEKVAIVWSLWWAPVIFRISFPFVQWKDTNHFKSKIELSFNSKEFGREILTKPSMFGKLEVHASEVVWRFEPITFYIKELRVKLILAPHGFGNSKDALPWEETKKYSFWNQP